MSADGLRHDAERFGAAAHQWAARRDRGLTPTEEIALAAWLEEDPRHAEAFRGAQATWARVGGMAWRSRAEDEMTRRWGWRLIPIGLAAAAALVFGGLHLGSPRPADRAAGRLWRSAAEHGPMASQLPDGSVARLNSGGSLQADYTAAVRQVRLQQGEAFFSVEKDPLRPFVVSAGGVSIRAVGTAFSVRLSPREVDVIVTEGTVAIAGLPPAGGDGVSDLAGRRVSAGQRLRYDMDAAAGVHAAPITSISRDEIEAELGWNRPLLQLAGATLGEVAGRFAEIGGRRIEIADASLAALKLGGQFPAGDAVQFVQVLAQLHDIRVEERADGTLVLHKRE